MLYDFDNPVQRLYFAVSTLNDTLEDCSHLPHQLFQLLPSKQLYRISCEKENSSKIILKSRCLLFVCCHPCEASLMPQYTAFHYYSIHSFNVDFMIYYINIFFLFKCLGFLGDMMCFHVNKLLEVKPCHEDQSLRRQ